MFCCSAVKHTTKLPKHVIRVGYRISKRKVVDTANYWTFVQTNKYVRHYAQLFGFRFYAKVAGRPLMLGAFKYVRKGQYIPHFLYRVKGRRIRKGYNLVSNSQKTGGWKKVSSH